MAYTTDDQMKEISLKDYKGKYLVLFFYPLDFTFVCPTEILAFSRMAADFRKIGCELVACSVDSEFCHMAYTKTPREQGGLGKIDIPLLSDLSRQISMDYGVIDVDKTCSLRGTFIIDANGILRHITVNDFDVGRSPEECLRLVQGFQHVDKHGEVCPASWKPGAQTMDPSHDSQKTKDFWKGDYAKK